MSETPRTPAGVPPVLQVAAGKDCLGKRRGLGISSIAFKLSARNSSSLFVLENTFRAKGGFLMFVPGDSGGGFVGEGMFYAGALQLIGAGALAVDWRSRSSAVALVTRFS